MNKNKIMYIVKLKDDVLKKLSATTLYKGKFAGKIVKTGSNMLFELNGSKANIIIPYDWIDYMAPSKFFWENNLNK